MITNRPPPFELAKLVREVEAMLRANWGLVCVLCVCFVVLPKLGVIATHLSFHGRLSDEDPAYDVLNSIDAGLDVACVLILQMVLTWALVRRKEGDPLAIGSFVRAALLLLIAGILTSIGILLGFLVFIVPGLMLLVRWSVVWPALLAEGRSSLDAMRRSATLVNGYGWPIFAGVVVCGLFQWLWEIATAFVGEALLGIWPDDHIDWLFAAVAAPWGSLPSIVFAIALYFHLVALKEGGTDVGIADVFD